MKTTILSDEPVESEDLSREAIFRALKERRCYGDTWTSPELSPFISPNSPLSIPEDREPSGCLE